MILLESFAYKHLTHMWPRKILRRNAVVVFQAANNSGVRGRLAFYQIPTRKGILIKGAIGGLKPLSVHGMHIHELGDLSQGCNSLGGHFNPRGQTHNSPFSHIKHAGDLGNIVANALGVANVFIRVRSLSLFNRNAIIGRSVVVHENCDDLGRGGNAESLINGNSGARIGCGVIGIANL